MNENIQNPKTNENDGADKLSLGKLTVSKLRSARLYAFTFIKWTAIALATGLAGGAVGGVFDKSVSFAVQLRQQRPWLVLLLPLGGVAIALCYRLAKFESDPGTNIVISSVRDKKRVPLRLGICIFFGTVVTQLTGGSAGREGAALQLGGCVGSAAGRLFRLDEKDMHLAVVCGMSAVFSALFGTPLTAVVFAVEVVSIGSMYYSSLVPCLFSSLTAAFVSIGLMRNHPVKFALSFIPELELKTVLSSCVVGVCCALVSLVFCFALKYTHKYADKLIKNPYLRAVTGALIIVALTVIIGNQRYNGTGMEIIAEIIGTGACLPYDFILKIIFTAVTIAAGFKGGEIIPTFFIGASVGCLVGSLTGLNPSFAAALGVCAMFCAMVNCPIASLILSVEVFGAGGFALFGCAIFISYMLSGYYGLYTEQRILYSKLKAEYININTK